MPDVLLTWLVLRTTEVVWTRMGGTRPTVQARGLPPRILGRVRCRYGSTRPTRWESVHHRRRTHDSARMARRSASLRYGDALRASLDRARVRLGCRSVGRHRGEFTRLEAFAELGEATRAQQGSEETRHAIQSRARRAGKTEGESGLTFVHADRLDISRSVRSRATISSPRELTRRRSCRSRLRRSSTRPNPRSSATLPLPA